MGVFAWIVGILLIAMGVMPGSMKLRGHQVSLEIRDHLGVSENLWKTIGGLELAGAVGVFVGLLDDGSLEWIGVVAALGSIALMIGAFVYHQRAGDGPKDMAPGGTVIVLAVLYLIGIAAR